jgi:hypothetical protein
MDRQLRRLVGEELWRSIVWAGLGMVGWPILVSELAWLEPSVLTVVVLPVLTWAVLTAAAIGIRLGTGADFQVQTPTGLSYSLLTGVVCGGLVAVYLAGVEGYSPLGVAAAYVVVTAGTLLWVMRPGVQAPS